MSNVYQLVISGFQGKQFYQNVTNWLLQELLGATPYTYALQLISAFEADVESAMLDCLPVTTTVTSYRAKRVTGGGGPSVVQARDPTTVKGTRTGDVSTSMAGPVLLSQALVNGKNVTGKWFLAGVSETDISENVFAGALNTAVNNLGSLLLSPGTLSSGYGTYQYTIYNRTAHVNAFPTGSQVGVIPGAQRRRMRPVF